MLKLPDGFLDLSPQRAEVFYFIRKKLFEIVSLAGFVPIITSSVEYIETYKLSGEEEEGFFSYIDPYEGKTACFRYDFTPQIARFISSQDTSKSYKIYYDGPVLRNEKILKGRMREIFQAGVEIINIYGIEADIFLLTLIKKIIKELKLKKSLIFLNDVNIFRSLLKDATKTDYYYSLKEAFISKNISEIEILINYLPFDKKRKDFILKLPYLCGDFSLLNDIEKKYDFEEIKPYIKNLKEIYKRTSKIFDGEILFDLGEIRGFEYHSGIIFDVYSQSENGYKEIITGGRYDKLLKNYTGIDIPATGFAIDLLNLTSSIGLPNFSTVIILTTIQNIEKAYLLAEKLRDYGYNTAIELNYETTKEKDFDLGIELYNNNMFAFKKGGRKKIKLEENSLKSKAVFEERLKELV